MKTNKNDLDLQCGKLPPQAIELEEAVLSAMLQMPASIDYITININADVFYKEVNRIIFEAAKELHRENKPVDMLTVTDRLKSQGKLELMGGPYYISQITNQPTHNYEYWCAILKQKYVRREAIRIGTELIKTGYDDSIDELQSWDAIDGNHKLLSDLLFGVTKHNMFTDVALQSFEELQTRIANAKAGNIPGITSGLVDLDKIVGGWAKGDLIILAGRPGMGKTAFALHLAKKAATRGNNIYLFSLEMAGTRLADRIIVGETEQNNYKYKQGLINELENQQVYEWISKYSNLPIIIDDKSFVSIDYIISNTRMQARKNKLDMIIIDYLQLIDMEVDRGSTKDQAIGKITRKLKSLARELDVPVILLSQLNRMVEDRGEKRPMLRDLRESGNIEQDADIVMFCYRPAYYNIKEINGRGSDKLMIIDIAKFRNGESNVDVYCKHNESLTNFYDDDENLTPQY